MSSDIDFFDSSISGMDTSKESSFEQKSNEIQLIFDHKIKHHGTYTGIQNIAQILNKSQCSINVPESKYLLKLKARYRFEKIYYIFCSHCHVLVLKGQRCGCVKCKSEPKKKQKQITLFIFLFSNK